LHIWNANVSIIKDDLSKEGMEEEFVLISARKKPMMSL
jgi:hypothetical protein